MIAYCRRTANRREWDGDGGSGGSVGLCASGAFRGPLRGPRSAKGGIGGKGGGKGARGVAGLLTERLLAGLNGLQSPGEKGGKEGALSGPWTGTERRSDTQCPKGKVKKTEPAAKHQTSRRQNSRIGLRTEGVLVPSAGGCKFSSPEERVREAVYGVWLRRHCWTRSGRSQAPNRRRIDHCPHMHMKRGSRGHKRRRTTQGG